jgi:putative transposase
MTHGSDDRHRRSMRLRGYDYSQAGAYFITICTQNRERLFGDIVTVGATPRGCPVAVLNDAGRMVQAVWEEIPMNYAGMDIDEFVVMPNHAHGILVVSTAVDGQSHEIRNGQARGPAPTAHIAPLSLGDIVHRFKTMTTKRYADGVKQSGWQPFEGRLWQRNYWEHIIRDEMELNRIREYIRNNPGRWNEDRMNLNRSAHSPNVHEPDAAYAAEGWMV